MKGRPSATLRQTSSPGLLMADIKKAPYEIAYEARQHEIEESLKSPHRGVEPSRDTEFEARPSRESINLGEGFKK